MCAQKRHSGRRGADWGEVRPHGGLFGGEPLYFGPWFSVAPRQVGALGASVGG